MNQKRNPIRWTNIAARLAVGAGGSILLLLGLSALLAWAVAQNVIGESGIGWGTGVSLLLASTGGSLLTVSGGRGPVLPLCLGTAAVNFLLLAAGHALLIETPFQGVLPVFAVVMGGSVAVGLTVVQLRSSGSGGRRRKYSHRKVVQNRQRGK